MFTIQFAVQMEGVDSTPTILRKVNDLNKDILEEVRVSAFNMAVFYIEDKHNSIKRFLDSTVHKLSMLGDWLKILNGTITIGNVTLTLRIWCVPSQKCTLTQLISIGGFHMTLGIVDDKLSLRYKTELVRLKTALRKLGYKNVIDDAVTL